MFKSSINKFTNLT